MGCPERGVSYVVTVYNKKPFLPLVIDGLIRQTGDFPREYIFVDDGSTDGSLAILRDLAGTRSDVRLIAQPNAGPSRALNRGLEEARMGYIKALDGDDILFPDATQRLLAPLNDDCRLAYGHNVVYAEIPANLERLLSSQSPPTPTTPDLIADHLPLSLEKSRMAPSCWLAETSLVKACGGCDGDIFIQDYSIELRMVARTTVARINTPVYLSHDIVDEGRLSQDVRQTLADANLAVAHFFAEHPQFLRRYGWLAARRVVGRAWLWSLRHQGKSIFSREYLRFLQVNMRAGSPLRLITESCDSFGDALRR